MNTLKKFLLDASGFKQEAKKHVKKYWLASPIGIIGLVLTFTAHAQDPAHLSRHSSEAEAKVFQAAGANASSIQSSVDQFRVTLGGETTAMPLVRLQAVAARLTGTAG